MPQSESVIFLLQEACLQHRFIRSKDLSAIVERPERLRAVNVGLSAVASRLEEALKQTSPGKETQSNKLSDPNDLADAINKLKIEPDLPTTPNSPIWILQSQAMVDIMHHPATKFIHGDVDRDIYLENLSAWIKVSHDKIAQGGSEIPEGLSQGDLYLCPNSLNALQGAVGTVCEAVDKVITGSRSDVTGVGPKRAFVAIRPPGHHCGENTPSGFCFLNNVVVAAAHAHLEHSIKRVVIFDIDLHHGNGTQSIIWQINEETYRQTLEIEGGGQDVKPGPRVYYGSIHDILSYPCEDGKPELVQAASVSLHAAHGQHIENVHLQTYQSEEHFWTELYNKQYSRLFTKAQEFLDSTGGPGDDAIVFISCGMDACEHEYESMSRHNRKVPTSFYYRFAQDAVKLSETYSRGRLISVLEGGYSDRALISGTMAHLAGLVDQPSVVDEAWWNAENLLKIEIATRKKRGGRPSLPAQGSMEPWIKRTLEIFGPIDSSAAASTASNKSSPPAPPSSRTLRDRTKGKVPAPTPAQSPSVRAKPVSSRSGNPKSTVSTSPPDLSSNTAEASTGEESSSAPKKLPRVILRLGKPPEEAS